MNQCHGRRARKASDFFEEHERWVINGYYTVS